MTVTYLVQHGAKEPLPGDPGLMMMRIARGRAPMAARCRPSCRDARHADGSALPSAGWRAG
jgi:hypothetical protein